MSSDAPPSRAESDLGARGSTPVDVNHLDELRDDRAGQGAARDGRSIASTRASRRRGRGRARRRRGTSAPLETSIVIHTSEVQAAPDPSKICWPHRSGRARATSLKSEGGAAATIISTAHAARSRPACCICNGRRALTPAG